MVNRVSVLLGSVLVAASMGVASPASADDTGVDLAAETGSQVLSQEEVAARQPAPSPYVEATSPADAEAKFAALDAAGPTALAASVRYGPCTLYPSVVYLRKSSDYSNVGSKPYTQCTVPVSSIRHSTDLRYKSFIWWRKATTKTGGNSGVASYTQRNVEYRCVSTESTGWSGTTAGTIVYGGRTYYARVYQAVKTLACGG